MSQGCQTLSPIPTVPFINDEKAALFKNDVLSALSVMGYDGEDNKERLESNDVQSPLSWSGYDKESIGLNSAPSDVNRDSVDSLSSRSASSVNKNYGVSNIDEEENPFTLLIEAFSRLRDLTQKLMSLLAGELNEKIDKTEKLTNEAGNLQSIFSHLKDDALWDWKKDEEFQKFLDSPEGKNIKIGKQSLREWLESVTKTKDSPEETETHWDPNPLHWKGGLHSGSTGHPAPFWTNFGVTKEVISPAGQEEGIPKYQLLKLQGVISAAATKEKDTSTQTQTKVTQETQNFQNFANAVINTITAQFRTLSSIFTRLSN